MKTLSVRILSLPALLCFTSFVLYPVSVKSLITFERAYGWENLGLSEGMDVQGNSVLQTPDGGYIIAGTESCGSPRWLLVIRTDSLGDTVWIHRYPGFDRSAGKCIVQAGENDYIIAGHIGTTDAGTNVLLVKIDSLGDTIWTRTYGGDKNDYANSIVSTPDGGYVVTGYTCSYGSGHSDIYLLKVDSLGDTIWTRAYGGEMFEDGRAVIPTLDGSYVVAGHGHSPDSLGFADIYIVKTDSFGDTVWTRVHGKGSSRTNEYAHCIVEGKNSSYLIAGTTGINGEYDVYVLNVDSLGDTVWTCTYNNDREDMAYSIVASGDGGYVMAGFTGDLFLDYGSMHLIKIDSLGDIVWTRSYEANDFGQDRDIGNCITKTNDGGYAITGIANWGSTAHTNPREIYLIKTDSLGRVCSVREEANDLKAGTENLTIYPNPFLRRTTIRYSMLRKVSVSLKVFDVSGRCVKTLVSGEKKSGYHETELGTKNLAPGVYFARFEAGNHKEVQKLILTR
jgi:hypothetical protein